VVIICTAVKNTQINPLSLTLAFGQTTADRQVRVGLHIPANHTMLLLRRDRFLMGLQRSPTEELSIRGPSPSEASPILSSLGCPWGWTTCITEWADVSREYAQGFQRSTSKLLGFLHTVQVLTVTLPCLEAATCLRYAEATGWASVKLCSGQKPNRGHLNEAASPRWEQWLRS